MATAVMAGEELAASAAGAARPTEPNVNANARNFFIHSPFFSSKKIGRTAPQALVTPARESAASVM
jgi:hypothetical protein